MSRHGRSGAGGRKRKQQGAFSGHGKGSSSSRDAEQPSSKKLKRANDMYYEAMDSDPDEEKHADRYDHVDNYEYELPSDFEDEEIDEEMAFTAEDKKLYAGWFGDEEGDEEQQQQGQGDSDEELDADDAWQQQQQGRRSKRSKLGEFADLESSSDADDDDDAQEGEDDEGEELFGDAEDYEEGLEQDDAAAAAGSDSDADEQQLGSGDGVSSDGSEEGSSSSGGSEGEEDESEELDDDAHRAMLDAVLGRGRGADAAADGRARQALRMSARNAAVVAEAYPESEAHAGTGTDGPVGGELRLSDLMAAAVSGPAAAAAPSIRSARKLLERLERQTAPLAAPLPRTVAERVERQAGYEDTKQDVTKWQPIVKANREAPTVRFTSARNEVAEAAASTAALVDGFTPNTEDPDGLEAQVAALLGAAGSLSAHAMAEAEESLAPKKFTAEEAAERAARLSKMRHLLFYAEQKAKRLAKIKSKGYHRRANKAAKRAAERAGAAAGDEEEAARLAAEEAEFERAKERLTLKHRNSSKWARRALKRGQAAMDPSTREAIAAQLALGQQLRRRVEGKRDNSDEEGGGSDDSTSASEPEDNEGTAGASRANLFSSRSRKEALAILKGLADPAAAAAAPGEGQAPDSLGGPATPAAAAQKGLFALPFMVRALEKQRQQAAAQAAAMLADMGAAGGDDAGADADAAAALDAFEEAASGAGGDAGAAGSGRLQFAGTGPVGPAGGRRRGAAAAGESDDELSEGSDSEEDVEAKAERLQRHLAGEAAAAAQGVAAVQQAADAAVAKASKQQQQQGSQQQQQPHRRKRGADVGYVEVQLAPAAAVAASGRDSKGAAAGAGAAAAANGVGAHAVLFAAQHKGKKGQQQQQIAPGGEGDAAAPSTSQPVGFMPSKVWQGPRPGYVFKRDKQGLGYYLDAAAAAAGGVGSGAKGGKHRQQQGKEPSVQQLLQRQQQQQGDSSSDEGDDAAAAAGKQQQQQRKQAAAAASGKAAANGTAAAAAGAMQLLSSEADVNRQLLQAAFAGDDVEADFAAEKAAEVEAELPPAEVAGQLPGWGTWSNQQREPAWMVAAKAKAAAQRASAAAGRKDASMKHVVISEKWDKKASKYLTPNLPFPFNDKQVYEHAMRQPLGRQYNPDAAFRNLTRPAVLKTTGVVIEPARFSKATEQYNAAGTGKGRAVVTIAGGMQLQGQAPGSGAGGVGKGGSKKKKAPQQQQQKGSSGGANSRKGKRLHEA